MPKKLIEGVNTGFIQPGFWEQIEKENNKEIMKYDPIKDYSESFNEEYLKMLMDIKEGPEMFDVEVGEVLTGVIESINKKEIVININYKDSVYVDIKKTDFNIIENLVAGDEIDVMITELNEEPYQLKGSITELIKMKVNDALRDSYNNNTPIIAKVTELIPAGFMLKIEMDNIKIDAFMPNTLAGVNRLTETQTKELFGKKIEVILETLQQEKGVYVVSRKKYLSTLIPEEISKLNKTDVYTGTVTGTKDFGVFVQFNECLTGMIHKVNLNPEYQDKLDLVTPGIPIDFYVRDILKGNKIILTQILRESLWDIIKVGQIRDAVVTGVKNFGVLVALDDETFGLIQNTYIQKANASLKQGDKIKVKVVSVIKDDRKIYLSLPE